jgi:hypothetical protein
VEWDFSVEYPEEGEATEDVLVLLARLELSSSSESYGDVIGLCRSCLITALGAICSASRSRNPWD